MNRTEEIERLLLDKYKTDVSEYKYEPSGDPGFYDARYSGYCGENWTEIEAADVPLVEEWEALTGEKLHRMSDEGPSFDDALGAVCDAKQRVEESRRMK